MLWAALFVFFCFMLGGSSENLYEPWVMKEAKSHFKEAIQDKERSKNAMKTLDEIIDKAEKFTKDLRQAEDKLEKLVKDYKSTPEAFNQMFSEIQGKREASTTKILDLIPDLKKNILREEWESAFKDVKQSQPSGRGTSQ